MERDFMGLNSSKDAIVKEEVVESSKDTGLPNRSVIPWPSSSKVSGLPRFMSFKAVHDEKPLKIVTDHLGSSGFMSTPSADVFDPNNRRQSSEVQMLPSTVGNSFFKSHVDGGGQNFGASTMKPQFIGGIPVTTPHSILPSSGFVAGTSDPRFSSYTSGAPAQLTIFYAGKVSVYKDIPPEKAQAIMFLVGSCCITNSASRKVQAQVPTSRIGSGEGTFMNKTMNTTPCAALSSPMSLSSHPIGKMGVVTIANDDGKASKAIGVSNTVFSGAQTLKMLVSPGPVSSSTSVPSAVPQARRASLARFLEKRKERVTSSAPYLTSKNSAGETNPETNFGDYSATSSTANALMSCGKETDTISESSHNSI